MPKYGKDVKTKAQELESFSAASKIFFKSYSKYGKNILHTLSKAVSHLNQEKSTNSTIARFYHKLFSITMNKPVRQDNSVAEQVYSL